MLNGVLLWLLELESRSRLCLWRSQQTRRPMRLRVSPAA